MPNNPTNPIDANDPENAARTLDLGLLETFPAPDAAEWRTAVEKDLKGADFDKKLVWRTAEGIAVQPLYTRKDADGATLANGLPGFAPFQRGAWPLSGVRPSWQVRQDMMLATPEEVNAALRDGIARGQNALGIRLDNAARLGLDGDDPAARELAGRGGCTISSINGMRIALQDIDLAQHPITIRTGTASLPVLAMLFALADEHGISRSQLSGAVECDPLRDLARHGRVRGSLELQYAEMAAMVRYTGEKAPGMRPVMVNSHAWHNAGASAVQELACVLAAGAEYVRALGARGINADTAGLAMLFSFSVGESVFIEIAKLRAARALWAKVMNAFGAKNEDALKMFMHARTSTFNKTAYDPYNNMVRTTIEAFAAAAGGADSLYVAPFDEAIGRPNEFSMRIARNQQLVLREESHLGAVVDPGAGSWYLESLTDNIAREAWNLFQKIEAEGGLAKALVAGSVQKFIGETAARRIKDASTRREPIVGVSNYPNPKETRPTPRHIPRAEFLAARVARLRGLKSVRHNSRVRALLQTLSNMAWAGEADLMETAIKAAREGATIGEIVTALNAGSEAESPSAMPLKTGRIARAFEELRDRSLNYADEHGEAPRVFLIPTGPLAFRRARADFSHGFFGAGGFQIEEPAAFESVDEAARAAIANAARVMVLCSDDATYPEFAGPFIKTVKAARPDVIVYVAGYPADSLEGLKAAGVDGFIHIKADLIGELTALQEKLGIRP